MPGNVLQIISLRTYSSKGLSIATEYPEIKPNDWCDDSFVHPLLLSTISRFTAT